MQGVRVAWAPVDAPETRRATVRRLLAELAPGAEVVQMCGRCGGAHGQPRLRYPRRDEPEAGAERPGSVSVAYAGGFAVVAVTGAGAVGVDAEPAGIPPRIDRVLRPDARTRDWTRVEAVLKADGRALRLDPALVEVWSADTAGAGWRARVGDRDVVFSGAEVPGPPGVVVSVAVAAPRA